MHTRALGCDVGNKSDVLANANLAQLGVIDMCTVVYVSSFAFISPLPYID